jgi:hypothetical protein
MNGRFCECELTPKNTAKRFSLMGDTVFFLSAMLSRISATIFSKPDEYLHYKKKFCLLSTKNPSTFS